MSGGQTTDPGVGAVGLAVVLALHAAVIGGLWSHGLIASPHEAVTLFVNFIVPPVPPKVEQPQNPPAPKRKPIELPRQIVAEAPVMAPTDYAVPAPPPVAAPVMQAPRPPSSGIAPPAPAPLPAGPVTLASELSVSCPERTAPGYPKFSQRLGEEGTVMLRVELNETGQVAAARVNSSSGYARLDEAALAAVLTWRCTPATRDGAPVRAVAMQPFKFMLQ